MDATEFKADLPLHTLSLLANQPLASIYSTILFPLGIPTP